MTATDLPTPVVAIRTWLDRAAAFRQGRPEPSDPLHPDGSYLILKDDGEYLTLAPFGYLVEPEPDPFWGPTETPGSRKPFRVPAAQCSGRGKLTMYQRSRWWLDADQIRSYQSIFGPDVVTAELDRIRGLGATEEQREAAWQAEFAALIESGFQVL